MYVTNNIIKGKEMQNVALIGCAHIHTPGFIGTLNKRDDVKVTAVWDHDLERGHRRAKELNAPFIKDLSIILSDTKISSVVIASETNMHEELVLAVTAKNKNLFVEKPLGMGAKDSSIILKAISDAGVIFQTGYFNRSLPIHIFIKEHISKGSFGKVTRIRHTNCHSGALGGWFDTEWRWMANPIIAGVGAFGDLGTHSLDIMLWMMGNEEVVSVTGNLDTAIARYDGCDEYGEAMLKFKNGAIGTIAAGWVDVANPCNLIVNGTKGAAWLTDQGLHFKSDLIESADGSIVTELPEMLPGAFDLYLDAINGKENLPLVSVTEAAIRGSVMEAIYIGAKSNSWVSPIKL